MKYEDGYLILSNLEVKHVTSMLMRTVEQRQHASSFVGTMVEVKTFSWEMIGEIEAKDTRTERDQLIAELLQVLGECCDMMIDKANDAAEVAGCSIKLQ